MSDQPTHTVDEVVDFIDPAMQIKVRLPSIAEIKLGAEYAAPVRLDPRILGQMQKAIQRLTDDYIAVLSTQVASLAGLAAQVGDGVADSRTELYDIVHDMRGLAGTFGYPLVGSFARSMCEYMEKRNRLDATIIRFHIDAMRDALERKNIDTTLAAETLRSLDRLIASVGDGKTGE